MFLSNLFSSPFYAVVAIIGLLLAITVHEFAHAWMANYLGDPTAKHLGRLTLNPFKHLDPLGTLFLLVAGFGWGKPVPYNPSNLRSDADEVKVALSGITANLLTALLLGIPLRIATAMGIAISSNIWLTIIEFLLEMNLVLIAFNIIPIPPLDGSKLIFPFISFNARMTFEQVGPILLFIVIIASNVFGSPFLVSFMEPIIRVLSFVTKGTYTAIF
ncbi:site-2 protease family protein [Candidatus Berkelbacteria bacterium CG08_land_8_20_14_0_20_39_8]|uniref:Site-2 protease family protein n=1 Tax=Candidatus Berkelbacteria bacterium CG08_land_8_20_14_0_20_39_8 TaxID=1974511 RepID=A0A2M6YBS4_9BACT|nr:MAG: site-2 protease family protein [Candidatus Berkelbacteria bacterium CG08_land_8_20_14_0_20_39_8]